MPQIPPPPLRDPDFTSPSWKTFFTKLSKSAVPSIDDPIVDNFASIDANGKIKDSGYDSNSFALVSHTHATSSITDFSSEVSNSINQGAISLLGSVTINGQTATKQIVYVVPVGKNLIPHMAYIYSPSASLAGLTDMDIGGDALASDWIQQISLDAFTSTTDYGAITQPAQAAGPPIVPAKKTIYSSGTDFGVLINTGSTNPATFIISLFGFLV